MKKVKIPRRRPAPSRPSVILLGGASTPLPEPPAPASTTTLREGDPAPDFRAPSDAGRELGLGDFRGRKVILYFYPKDDTPGCTTEACAFRDGIARLQERGVAVLGVSADSVDSHQQFRDKYQLNFPLLSDEAQRIVNDYGVWKEKNLYGRTYWGIERTTFLIDEAGRIQRIFPKVNVELHYQEVLDALES